VTCIACVPKEKCKRGGHGCELIDCAGNRANLQFCRWKSPVQCRQRAEEMGNITVNHWTAIPRPWIDESTLHLRYWRCGLELGHLQRQFVQWSMYWC